MNNLENTVPDAIHTQEHRTRRYSRALSPTDASLKPLYKGEKRTKAGLIFKVKSGESEC